MSVEAHTPPTDRPANGMTDPELDLCLTVLAICGGSGRRAQKELLEHHGIETSNEALYKWKRYPRYERIRAELAPKLQEQVAQQCEDAANRAHEVETNLLERLATADIDDKDLAKSLKFVTDSKGTNIDKAALLRGRPTQITEHRDATSLIRKLQAQGVVTVEGTAREPNNNPPALPVAVKAQTDAHAYERGPDPAAVPASSSTAGDVPQRSD